MFGHTSLLIAARARMSNRIFFLTLGLVTACLTGLPGCTSPASLSTAAATRPPPPPLAKFECRSAVEALMAQAGLSLEQLQDIKVQTEPMAGGDQVAYYSLNARPETCASGTLSLRILPDCSIDRWETTPPCRLTRLEPAT
ncbi:MAG: hypothetical protein HC834_02895 [Rhodospirillales bacterium]|nr:hypothetical protein [Rhodospirillales bacterium]